MDLNQINMEKVWTGIVYVIFTCSPDKCDTGTNHFSTCDFRTVKPLNIKNMFGHKECDSYVKRVINKNKCGYQ